MRQLRYFIRLSEGWPTAMKYLWFRRLRPAEACPEDTGLAWHTRIMRLFKIIQFILRWPKDKVAACASRSP
ncbi:hypothetical protein CKA81_08025 [Pollutimonas thiosulfatoxidans]|uniref:Uncharacterized protein n=1 Tax=Pollutimonas thiosulfatoxidans TaxID=2028345 RepID=A0A410GBV0_9BURK|nr:hypothetical protein CKA81_08025 [Pollutimonas thiosulfatoxidans]